MTVQRRGTTEPAAERPRISALLSTYNGADLILRALRGVVAQTLPVHEIIVVDDGSTDDTAQRIAQEFPAVKYLFQENTGGKLTYEYAWREARGEWLAFCDMDDQWFPRKLERQWQVVRRHPAAALVLCQAQMVPETAPWPTPPQAARGKSRGVDQLTFRDWFYRRDPRGFAPPMSGWLLRRQVVEEVGGLNPAGVRGTDYASLLRLTYRGHAVLGLRERLYFRALRAGSMSHSAEWVREALRHRWELLAEFDPEGAGWGNDLLSPEEYRLCRKRWLKRMACWANEIGDSDYARQMLEKAARLPSPAWALNVEMRMAHLRPRTYFRLRR